METVFLDEALTRPIHRDRGGPMPVPPRHALVSSMRLPATDLEDDVVSRGDIEESAR